MTLMHLMENAIKHNEVTKDKPLNICITVNDGHLLFKNNVNPRYHSPSLGGSLTTLKELYRLRTNRGVEVKSNGEEFKVSIQLINRTES
jgi:hypothetical protein